MTTRFRKRPVVIEAVQWTGRNAEAIHDFMYGYSEGAIVEDLTIHTISIETLEGVMTASVGDWIIRGVKGELYPCKPDIFEVTYEAVL